MHAADKEILADFQRSRRKTIDLLKKLPASLLTKKARGEDDTTGDLFRHIALVVDGWMFRCMVDGGPPPDWNDASKPTKASLLAELRSSERRLLKFFNAGGGRSMNKVFTRKWKKKSHQFIGRNRVQYLTQHEVHHRGKIALALRQWGFTRIPFLPFE